MSFKNNGKGKKLDNQESFVWYHGSPLTLEILEKGHSVTRNRSLAIAFSHKPTSLSVKDDGTISHNGKQDGFLYQIDEQVHKDDIYIHPACNPDDAWEWVTKRPFRLKLIEKTKL